MQYFEIKCLLDNYLKYRQFVQIYANNVGMCLNNEHMNCNLHFLDASCVYSFKKELLFSLEFPVLHMTAVFLVHKADDEDHIWSCEIHFGSTVEQDSKFFTFRVAEFHNIEIINLYEVLTFLWTLNCSSTTAVVKDTFFRKSRPEGPRQQNLHYFDDKRFR